MRGEGGTGHTSITNGRAMLAPFEEFKAQGILVFRKSKDKEKAKHQSDVPSRRELLCTRACYSEAKHREDAL